MKKLSIVAVLWLTLASVLSAQGITPTRVLTSAGGTVTAPVFSFLTDPTLGIYRVGSGVMGVSGGWKLQSGATLYSGTALPGGGLGANGDFYFRTPSGELYSKISGTWTLFTSGGGGGGGTVTSVDMTLPSFLSVTGNPVTTSGTLAVTLATQAANRVFAGPTSGGAAVPTWRQIVFADWAQNGCSTNEIPKWNGSLWACASDATGGGGGGTPAGSTGDVQINSAGAFAAVSPGTTGYVLTSNGAGVAPSFLAAAGGSGGGGEWILVDTKTASASASLDFTTGITSTYDQYKFVVRAMIPSSDGENLQMRVSHNAGTSWDSSTGNYSFVTFWHNDIPLFDDYTQSSFSSQNVTVADVVSNSNAAGLKGVAGTIVIDDPAAASQVHQFTTEMHLYNANANQERIWTVGRASVATAINGVQFKFGSGTMTSGVIQMWGHCISSCGSGGGGGSGTVTTTGTPGSGDIAQFSGSTSITTATATGTGSVVRASSPALTTPNLGTPSAATLTNATGLPLTTGVTGVLPAANGGAGTVNGIMQANGSGTVSAVTVGAGLSLASGTLAATGTVTRSFGITIDGAGSAITTGVKGFVQIPISGTIAGWTLLSTDAAATAGSIVIEVDRDTYANYPPTSADKVCASACPTLSSANKNTNSSLGTWTTAVTAGDVVGFEVTSATTVTRVTLIVTVTGS